MIYEILTDEVPFYSETLTGVYNQIMNHEKYFAFPDDVELSKDSQDLIKKWTLKNFI